MKDTVFSILSLFHILLPFTKVRLGCTGVYVPLTVPVIVSVFRGDIENLNSFKCVSPTFSLTWPWLSGYECYRIVAHVILVFSFFCRS